MITEEAELCLSADLHIYIYISDEKRLLLQSEFIDIELRCSGDVASAGLILLRGINIMIIIIINHHLNKFLKDVLVPEPASSIFRMKLVSLQRFRVVLELLWRLC